MRAPQPSRIDAATPAAEAVGLHVVVDGWNASAEALDDEERVRAAVVAAARAAGATVIDVCVHRFNPYGVTAVATLAESHLAVHTWPELGYFAADLFYCGKVSPDSAVRVLATALGAESVDVRSLGRGPGR